MDSAELDDSMQDGADDLSDDMNDSGMDLLWKGVVKPDEPLVAAPVERFFLRITNACFGPEIQKNTRTCLQVAQQSDEESEPPGTVCTLRNNYENHPLKLLISDDVQFTVAGENPSPIYLVGYWTPAEQHVGDTDTPFDFDDMEEMDEEELADMDDKTKRKLLQQVGRKRKLDEMEKDTVGDEDEENLTSAQKKQKTATGKAKPTNQPQGKNDNKNKNQNPKQNQNQNQNQKNQKNQNKNKKQNSQQANETAVSKTQETAGDEKEPESGKGMTIKQTKTTETVVTEISNKTPTNEGDDSNKQAKDDSTDKEWKNGPQGLKYKDIRAGEGKPVKKGSKLRVFYVGQLPNKKVFDKSIENPGFEFTVGDGEVIQGWEKGLFGMKAGGKRRLLVPPKLGYGEEGSMPDIPPNTELTFTIEVKDVN